MAETSAGTSGFDLAGIVSSSLKASESTGGTSVSAKVQSPANLDTLTQILQTATGAVAAESAKQKLVLETEGKIAAARAELATSTAGTKTAAALATGKLTEAQVAADYETQLKNKSLRETAGLDVAGVLGNSIKAINERTDSYVKNVELARHQGDMTVGAMLRGNATFSEWYDAKFSHPASGYEEHAATDATVIAAEANRIKELQGIVSGQAQINKATEVTLYAGAAADAQTVAAEKLMTEANSARESALAIGADYATRIMSASQHKQATAYQTGSLALGVENAKRQWALLGAKDKDPAVLAGYVRVAMKSLGRPDADLYTAQYVGEYKSMNPKQGAMIDTLANAGMQLVGHQLSNADSPLPPVFGSPAEAYTLLSTVNGKLPQGSEKFQSRLMTLAAGTDRDSAGGAVKPADQAARINGAASMYVDEVVRDTDSSEYGQPVLAPLTEMASMNTPEVSSFTAKILRPLAAANPTVSAEVLLAAVKSSDLPESVKIAGLIAYANSASAQIDALGRPQLVGLPAASALPYTATASSGSLFGSKINVNLKDEKSVRDYLFKTKMYQKAKTNSLTIVDAAAATIIAGKEKPQ